MYCTIAYSYECSYEGLKLEVVVYVVVLMVTNVPMRD